MATATKIYYIHLYDSTSTVPPTGLDAADIVHSFRSQDGYFIAAVTEPRAPGFQNISVKFSCDNESFLHAAAAAQIACLDAKLAYQKIISDRSLEENFESPCEARDRVIIDHLEATTARWLEFAQRLNKMECQAAEQSLDSFFGGLLCLKSSLYRILADIQNDIDAHPLHWRQVLYTPLPALADCIGRIQIFLPDTHWPWTLGDSQTPVALLKPVKERCKKGMGESLKRSLNVSGQDGIPLAQDRA